MIMICIGLLCSSCNLPGSEVEGQIIPQPPAGNPDDRCGDGTCEGIENPQNCPADCPAPAAQQQGQENPPESQQSDQQENVSANPGSGEAVLGMVYATIELLREGGMGNCGVSPWLSSDCSEPKIWWGLDLSAAVNTYVLIIPDGNNRWVVTNQADVVSRYDFSGISFDQANGYYQNAAIDFSSTPGCAGEITGQAFSLPVMGTVENGDIELILSAAPHEIIEGACSGVSIHQDITVLMYGWAAALSGDPLDMTARMSASDRTNETGVYSHTYAVNTNPSPQNRDQAIVTLELWCVEKVSGGANPVACPWE